jgi:hypothetical protein
MIAKAKEEMAPIHHGRTSSAVRVTIAVLGDPAGRRLVIQIRDGFPNAAPCVAAARCTTHGKAG